MSCIGGEESKLYLLEIFIDSLNLNSEKMQECSDNSLLVVKIKFLTLPIFVISPPSDFDESVNSNNETANGSVVFSSGKSCLFGKRPRDLVREMQTTPLKIGIFCVDNTYPIAEVTLPLSGCLCDQIAMAMNDHDHLPEPYVLTGLYGLLDPGKNPSGSLSLELKIICLGKHVTTQYQMKGNEFLFKSNRDEGQYSVKRIKSPVESVNQKQDQVATVDPQEGNIESQESESEEKKKKKKKKNH